MHPDACFRATEDRLRLTQSDGGKWHSNADVLHTKIKKEENQNNVKAQQEGNVWAADSWWGWCSYHGNNGLSAPAHVSKNTTNKSVRTHTPAILRWGGVIWHPYIMPPPHNFHVDHLFLRNLMPKFQQSVVLIHQLRRIFRSTKSRKKKVFVGSAFEKYSGTITHIDGFNPLMLTLSGNTELSSYNNILCLLVLSSWDELVDFWGSAGGE